MKKENIRALIYSTTQLPISLGTNVIIRQFSYGLENDIKEKNMASLEYMLRDFMYPDVCIVNEIKNINDFNPLYVFNSGLSLMMEEKYWLAHEYFEILWKSQNKKASRFFHSVVTLCVAMVHHQMGRQDSKIRIFNNGKQEMAEFFGDSVMNYEFSYPLDPFLISQIKEYGIKIIQSSELKLERI